MRLGLLASLLVHAGVVGTAWLLCTPETDASGPVPGTYLYIAPRLLPERPVPPPPELIPPAAAREIILAPPAEATQEPVELTEAILPLPPPFRLRSVTKLATPLPARRKAPVQAPPVARKPVASRSSPKGKFVAPRLLRTSAARYPARARRLGWEGRVVLELHVSARGTVEKVEIAVSSGHTVLDRAAAEAALRWSFRPATRDGKPVAHTVRAPVEFTLVPP